MTEPGWIAYQQPGALIDYLVKQFPTLAGPAGLRKRRLFAYACCREIWDAFPNETFRRAVQCVERAADCPELESEIQSWLQTVEPFVEAIPLVELRELYPDRPDEVAAHVNARPDLAVFIEEVSRWGIRGREAARAASAALKGGWAAGGRKTFECDLVRDLFGNPFRPVKIEQRLLIPKVERIAQAIYQDRDFELMPVLSDALEEAGCANADILEHCRMEPLHVRGCWLIDLLLGKACE